MSERAEAVVIGGGIVGTAIAYNLAARGMKDVILVEKGYLASGSTGRCGAGIRQQWGTEMNCRLARESIKMFERMNEELEYRGDIELKQGGYMMLAYTERMMEQFARNVALQRRLGVPVNLITPEQAREIVPHLNTDGLLGATFCQEDGHCNPFHATQAYAEAAMRLGVRVRTFTEVTAIHTAAAAITGVSTNRGDISTPIVVNATGPYAQIVAAMAGVDMPTYAERHQILVTEPVEPMQGPMVISLYHRIYCQQTPHGSFIMGLGDPNEPRGYDIGHSWQFLEEMAGTITRLLPALKEIRLVRQWSGLYDMTPDAQPILGGVPWLKGYYTACGFSGHGFMIAPMTGVLMAEHILGLPMSMPINMLDLGRFERGELIREPSVV